MPNVSGFKSHGLPSIFLQTEVSCKAVCLGCNENVVFFKDYNFSHHFHTKHLEKYLILDE